MLQSIQYIGSGPPTYVFSQKAAGADSAYYYVFAAETRGYDERQERRNRKSSVIKHMAQTDEQDDEKSNVLGDRGRENLQEVYQKEYGKRESFLWKLR